MNYRPFWKRSFIPAAVIITSLLASTLLIPVGSAYWTETLWGNVSVSPLEKATQTPSVSPTLWATATPTPGALLGLPTQQAPTPTLVATEGPPKGGAPISDPWTPTASVQEPVPTEALKPPPATATAEPQEPVKTEPPTATEAPGDTTDDPDEPTDGSGEVETLPPSVPQPAGTEEPGTGEEDEVTPPAPGETEPPEGPGEGDDG